VMGMGNCLTEEYIVENGVPWSTLLRVIRFQASNTRRRFALTSWKSHECGALRREGVGEITSINTTPAIANAIVMRPASGYTASGRPGCSAARHQGRREGRADDVA